jgi:hypothetical protein
MRACRQRESIRMDRDGHLRYGLIVTPSVVDPRHSDQSPVEVSAIEG